ncbi:MAG: hypothetical protein ABFD98_11050 [Syntrophobacteraceae bacterium]|nr:hypothetical protein [Desulfobacteraceae bacterium]
MNRSHSPTSGGGFDSVRAAGRRSTGVCAAMAAVLLLAVSLTGCAERMVETASSRIGFPGTAGTPARCNPIEVLVQSNLPYTANTSLGILLAGVPGKTEADAESLTRLYYEELIRTNAFRSVKVIPQTAGTREDALWIGRRDGFDFVMVPAIRYILDSSGNLPTRLDVSVDILDVRTASLAWSVRQSACSEPGRDMDLVWMTLAGEHAQRVHSLSKALAGQFAGFMIGGIPE